MLYNYYNHIYPPCLLPECIIQYVIALYIGCAYFPPSCAVMGIHSIYIVTRAYVYSKYKQPCRAHQIQMSAHENIGKEAIAKVHVCAHSVFDMEFTCPILPVCTQQEKENTSGLLYANIIMELHFRNIHNNVGVV